MCISLTRPTKGYFYAHYCLLLLNIFSDKDSHVFIRESKRMGTCDPKDDQERS